jgi:RNA polymerase sigma-70 factor (ECF subfamily)
VSQSLPSENGAAIESEELFRRYAQFVAGFLRHQGVGSAELDDMVQEVFLTAHRKGGYRPGAASPTTFLARLALDSLRWFRRRNRRVSRERSLPIASSLAGVAPETPESEVRMQQAALRLQAALDALDPDSRAIFLLYELEGESCASIAAGLGLKLGTVYSRLHYGRVEFRGAMARAEARSRDAEGRHHGLRAQALTRK